MTRVLLKPTAGPDGRLYIQVPVEADGEYLVEVTPSARGPGEPFLHPSWPPGFFDNVIGASPDFPDCDDGFDTRGEP